MKQSTFSLYYFSIGILFIVLEHLHSFLPALIVKALIIPALMLYFYSRAKTSLTTFHRLILLGLFFSWLGDILLQFSNAGFELCLDVQAWFMLGLAAYFITQVTFSVAFSLQKGRNTIIGRRIYQVFIVAGYGFLLLWFLYNHLGDMKIPVIVYAAAILTMLTTALNRYGKVNGVSYMLVTIGALLFVFSDSMIAVNRFYEKIDFARIFIMATYVTAQYLIAIGCLRQDFDSDTT
ncbi:MAG TPA: lysoplasmalogenase [Bacteroidales bacterium]|nr:lysoplasmalogenase [Bacteroidales bacterium]